MKSGVTGGKVAVVPGWYRAALMALADIPEFHREAWRLYDRRGEGAKDFIETSIARLRAWPKDKSRMQTVEAGLRSHTRIATTLANIDAIVSGHGATAHTHPQTQKADAARA